MPFPSRSQIAQAITQYVLSHSPLTTVGPFSGLQAVANAVGAVVEDFYRDLEVSLAQQSIQGLLSAFDFSPLSPTSATGSVTLYGTPGATIPAGLLLSTQGSPGSPAAVFQTTQQVTLLPSDPTSPVSLAEVTGGSAFAAGQTVFIRYAYASQAAPYPTFPSPSASLTIAAAGDSVQFQVNLPAGAQMLVVYAGPTSSASELGRVGLDGSITYSGSAASGLSATVSGTTVTVTVSGLATPDGASPTSVTGAGSATVTITAASPGSSGNVGAGQITNIVTANPDLYSVTNQAATSGGTDPETTDHLLQRFQSYLQTLSRGTKTALEVAALHTPGVLKAKAIPHAYLAVYANQGSTWTDLTVEVNQPKGVPVNPFPSALSVGDAVYFGADRPLAKLYFDVSTQGSGLQAKWQYWGQSGWTDLVPTLDQSSLGQVSGSVTWTVPSDVALGTVNGAQAFWTRIVLTGTAGAPPSWYQVISLDPPPGFVLLYVQSDPTVTGVLPSVQKAVYDASALGVTVSVLAAKTEAVNVSASLTPTVYGAQFDLGRAASNALAQLFSDLGIGETLSLSSVYSALSGIYGGQGVSKVTVTSPTTDVIPPSDTLLVPGTISIQVVG